MNSSRPESRKPSKATSLTDIPELFTPDFEEATPGSLNDEFVIRALITEAIRKSPKSRQQIADEMTLLLGTQVTRRSLDSYTSESADQNRWPAQYTRAFCHVTRDWSLLRCVSERAGLQVISKAEAKLLELGRQHMIHKKAAAAILALEAELAEVAL